MFRSIKFIAFIKAVRDVFVILALCIFFGLIFSGCIKKNEPNNIPVSELKEKIRDAQESDFVKFEGKYCLITKNESEEHIHLFTQSSIGKVSIEITDFHVNSGFVEELISQKSPKWAKIARDFFKEYIKNFKPPQ